MIILVFLLAKALSLSLFLEGSCRQKSHQTVTQRLLNATTGFAIADNPGTRPLSVNHLDKRFKEQLITHDEKGLRPQLQALNTPALKTIQGALEDIILGSSQEELDEPKRQALQSLVLSEQAMNQFIEEAKDYYSPVRFSAYRNFKWLETQYADIPTFVRAMAKDPANFYFNEIRAAVEQTLEARPPEIEETPNVYTPSRKCSRDGEGDELSHSAPEPKRARTKNSGWCTIL